jgi:hypothetical protein
MADNFIETWDKFERGLDARAQHLPRWIIPACIAVFILAAAFLYLYP